MCVLSYVDHRLRRILFHGTGTRCFWATTCTSNVVSSSKLKIGKNSSYSHQFSSLYFTFFTFHIYDYNRRVPFDSKTPLGYFLTIFMLYIFVLNVTRCSIPIATYGIGIPFMLVSLTEDLKVDVSLINEMNKLQANRLQIIKQQSEMLHFHAEIKE